MKKMNVFLNLNIEAKKLSSWILLSVLGILWGSSFLSVKYAINAFDPIQIASLRIIIGLLGAFLGVFLGLLLSLHANSIVEILGALLGRQLINPDVYLIDHLPTWIRVSDVAVIFLSCLLLTIIASLYPAYRASSVRPVEVMGSEN